jgi:hypothetical protein
MQPRDDGLILAHPPGRRVGLVVEPTFFADQVRIDVRRVVVGGVAVRVPRRFAPSRTFTIPPPAPSLTVLDARAEGGDVVIRFRHEGVRYPLPLDKLRGAILSGVATIRV